MTVSILGHKVEVLEVKGDLNRMCRRSGTDHLQLKHEARASRQAGGFDVDESVVLCTRCGLAVALK